jgi:hypothetical protein
MEDNIKNIRLIDSVWCYLNLLSKAIPPGPRASTMKETMEVLLCVRQSLARGTKLHGVLSDRESMLEALAKLDHTVEVVEGSSAEEAAQAILDDLRKDGIL